MNGDLRFLVEVAEDDARRAAQAPKIVVFCPPIAVFDKKDHAREEDLAAGPALSVDCDQYPQAARERLEQILGRATIVVRSGGMWTDPQTGEMQDKLHLHWRLARPASGDELAKLKQARKLAARIVGGDPSNDPTVHPIRWPGSWHRKGKPRLCEIETANLTARLISRTRLPNSERQRRSRNQRLDKTPSIPRKAPIGPNCSVGLLLGSAITRPLFRSPQSSSGPGFPTALLSTSCGG